MSTTEAITKLFVDRLSQRGLTAEETEHAIKYDDHYLPYIYAAADAIVDRLRTDRGNEIIRMVRNIRRDLSAKKAINSTDYAWLILNEEIMAMPVAEGPKEVELVYFRLPEGWHQLEQEYRDRNLKPDVYAQIADNTANPEFAEHHHNACVFDHNGEVASEACFYKKNGERILRFTRSEKGNPCSVYGGKYSPWYAGVRYM